MPYTSAKVKARWNAANYAQVKVSVRPDIADAFKAACTAAGISMAGELSRVMAEYAAMTPPIKTVHMKTEELDSVSTMKKRQNTVRTMTALLEQVKDAEEQFVGNAPENLQSAPIYEKSGEYVDEALENIIEQLGNMKKSAAVGSGYVEMVDANTPYRRAGETARFGVRFEFTTASRGIGYGKLSGSLCACGNKKVCRLSAD
jgi:DNA gyrase/topoisomerase IV subunit B